LAILSSLNINLEDYKGVELQEEDKKKLNEYIEDNRIICEKMVDVRFLLRVRKRSKTFELFR
jgi:hypothetical protein